MVNEQYKAGDKVRIQVGVEKGTVATVHHTSGRTGLHLSLPDLHSNHTLWYVNSEVEPVVETPKFKVGDRVKIVEPRTKFNGREGEIIAQHPDLRDYDYTVRIDAYGFDEDGLGFNADELEKIEPEPDLEPAPVPEPLKIGDRVTFNFADGRPSKYNGGTGYIVADFSTSGRSIYPYTIVFDALNDAGIRGYDLGVKAEELVKI